MKNIGLYLFFIFSASLVKSQPVEWSYNSRYMYVGNFCFYKEGLITAPDSDGWTQITSANINLDPDTWHSLKFDIVNKDSIDRSLLLFLHNAQLDSAYYRLFQGVSLTGISSLTGCNMPVQARPTADRTLSIPLLLESNQKYTLIMYVYGREFEIAVTPQLVDPVFDNDFDWTDSAYFVLFIFIAICLFISVALFFFLWKFKQRVNTFAWFIIYGIFGSLHLLATSGYGSLYIWGCLPFVEVNAAIFTGAICCLALLEMAGVAMRMTTRYEIWAKVLRYFGLFYVSSAWIGFLHFFPFWPPGLYKTIIGFSYIGMIIAHSFIAYFYLLSKENVMVKGRYWLGMFYLLHLLFYIAIICVENNYISYDHKIHTLINLIFYIPQMVLVIFYLILNYIFIMEKMRMEELVLKDNILTKLYTEVSEPLSKIHLSLYALPTAAESIDFQNQVSKLASDVQLARRQLNDLYYAMKPGVVNLSDLYNDLKNWISEYWKDTQMRLDMTLDLKNANLELDPLVKAQLMFIIKEINNNCAKYAQASILVFNIEQCNESEFIITVSDNGIGLKTGDTRLGHGIEGIKARMKKIGGSTEIISNPGEGVCYRLRCKNKIT